jgi:hypothetical protein
LSLPNLGETPSEVLDANQSRGAGAERLLAKEDPASVARDLSLQGLPSAEIHSLFQTTAKQQRRRAIATLIVGGVLSLIILFGVWGAMDAGFTCMGPGLAAGLFVTLRGVLKLKNAIEIARAGEAIGRQNQRT